MVQSIIRDLVLYLYSLALGSPSPPPWKLSELLSDCSIKPFYYLRSKKEELSPYFTFFHQLLYQLALLPLGFICIRYSITSFSGEIPSSQIILADSCWTSTSMSKFLFANLVVDIPKPRKHCKGTHQNH